MTTVCAQKMPIRSIAKKRSVTANPMITFLVCVSVLLQYAIVFSHETGLDESSAFISAILTPVNCLLYLLIALLCSNKIARKRIAIVACGAVYLFVRTVIAGSGIASMFYNIELIVAVVIFGCMEFPRKTVKQICLFSVFMYLLVLITSPYDGEWFTSRIFTNIHLNRNHFGVLTVVNMYMALTLLKRKGRKLRLSYLIVYAIGLAVIIPTTSRTSLICCILFILFHIYTIKAKRVNARRLFEFFAVCGLLSLFAIFILAYLLPNVVGADFKLFGRSILSGRNSIYIDAFNSLVNNNKWLFGEGVWSDFSSSLSMSGGTRTNTHNQWMQFFLNYGLVYLLFMIYAYLTSFKKIIGKGSVSYSALFLTMFQILLFVYFTTEAVHFYRSYTCLFLVIYFTHTKTATKTIQPTRYFKQELL